MKRVIFAALTLVGLAVCLLLALPWLLSAQSIKDAIQSELARITDKTITLNGDAHVTLTPYLGITYDNVKIGGLDSAEPLLVADELQGQLQVRSVFLGKPKLNKIRLIRPRLNLTIDASGKPNWRNANGKNKSGNSPSFGAARILFTEAIVTYRDARNGTMQQVTSLEGVLDWPNDASTFSSVFAGIWNGEAFEASAKMSNRHVLWEDAEGTLVFSITASPVELSYSGRVQNDGNLKFDGVLNANSPSPARTMQWIGRPLPATSLIQSLGLNGAVSGTLDKLTLPEVAAKIGGASGEGRLSFNFDPKVIAVNGTLAFDAITLPTLAELGQPVDGSVIDNSSTANNIADGLAMDVRLSANSAISGPFEMKSLAASLFVKDGKALFDIAQAEALDGTVVGTFQPNTEGKKGFSNNMSFTNIDLSRLASLYGKVGIGLNGQGNAKFKLESSAPDEENVLSRLNGSVSISGENGTLSGIGLNVIDEAFDDPNSIKSSDVFSGSTNYDSVTVSAYIANGIAFFQDSELKSGDTTVTISGRSDLNARSLGLQGKILRTRPAAEDSSVPTAVALPFLIGGTASAPLFIPLPKNEIETGLPNKIPTIAPAD